MNWRSFYEKSGFVHVAEIGGLMKVCNWWNIPFKYFSMEDSDTNLGTKFCDIHGIFRIGRYCSISGITNKFPKLYSDIESYML